MNIEDLINGFKLDDTPIPFHFIVNGYTFVVSHFGYVEVEPLYNPGLTIDQDENGLFRSSMPTSALRIQITTVDRLTISFETVFMQITEGDPIVVEARTAASFL